MSTVTFDTFKFVDRLEKAGASRELAAAIVEAQKDAFAEALDTALATKADIQRMENRLGSIENRLDAMEYRLTIKMGALVAGAVGVVAALVKLL